MHGEPFVIEWYRPDRMRALWRIWGLGSLFVCGGALGCGWAFVRFTHANAESLALTTMLIGLAMIASGMIYVLRRTWRILDEETCFVLRSDGVTYLRPGQPAPVIGWDRLHAVHVEADTILLVTDDDDEPVRVEGPFAGTRSADLGKRVTDTQRKALMGLIRRGG